MLAVIVYVAMTSESTTTAAAPSEGTPLLSPSGAKAFIDDLTSKATKSFEDIQQKTERSIGDIQTKTREVFSDENVVKTKEFASTHFNLLKDSTITGNVSIRYIAFFGAALLFVSAIVGFFKDSFTSAPAGTEILVGNCTNITDKIVLLFQEHWWKSTLWHWRSSLLPLNLSVRWNLSRRNIWILYTSMLSSLSMFGAAAAST